MRDMDKLADDLVAGTLVLISKELAPVLREIADLREENKALTARVTGVETKGLSYQGIWQRACDYARGSVVTDAGSAWVAVRATTAGDRPGACDGWQLFVKAGRDGKDAR